MGGPATTENVDQLAHVLDFIRSQLTEHERNQFALEMLAALRGGDEREIRRLLIAWLVSIRVSQHPEFRRQVKEYLNLVESGELFAEIQAIQQSQAQEG